MFRGDKEGNTLTERAMRGHSLHPVIVMVFVVLAAALLTYIVPAGHFERHGVFVVPGSYHAIPKVGGAAALFAAVPLRPSGAAASAASIVSVFQSIPAGLVKNASLIFMVMFVGGMFGVLRRTGAVDAAADRLVHRFASNAGFIIPVVMIVLGLGSTFLGFISEYLVLIPIVGVVGERLGYRPLFAAATVGVAAKVGYATSVTNPLALVVAQPLAHVPLFSGVGLRLLLFIVFLGLGIAYVMLRVRREVPESGVAGQSTDSRLDRRHVAVLLCLALAGVMMVAGSVYWGWREKEISAYYIAVSLVLAAVGGLPARDAADAFVDGLKSMMLAALLIGLAGSVQVLLQQSAILDTLIHDASQMVAGQSRPLTASGIMAIEMMLGVLVPSTAGKVAVSMPVLAPIAQLSGVSGQTTVLAFVLGNGLTNMITPTSGMLLAYLATARVSFTDWLRFVWPLFACFLILSVVAVFAAVTIGY